mmetsp:Transcript_22895/g.55197  ORF Transcript_22895/g.55197 Transcript_22895/m.55197 type:complete len:130 (-) Transcript_22895:1987-2376(-)
MGSGQSSSVDGETEKSSSPTTTLRAAEPTSSQGSSSPTKSNKTKIRPPKNESGYSRAQRKCHRKKRAYDACYTAQLSSKEEDCSDFFEAYRTCFLRVMAKNMESRGVQVSENSMIGEYKEEVAEEDNNR